MRRTVIVNVEELEKYKVLPIDQCLYEVADIITSKLEEYNSKNPDYSDAIYNLLDIYKFLKATNNKRFNISSLTTDGDDEVLFAQVYNTANDLKTKSRISMIEDTALEVFSSPNKIGVILQKDRELVRTKINSLIDIIHLSNDLTDQSKKRLISKLEKLSLQVQLEFEDVDSIVGFAFETQQLAPENSEIKNKAKEFVDFFLKKITIEKAAAAYGLTEGITKLLG